MQFVLLRTREQVASLSHAATALTQRAVAFPNATYSPEYFLPRLYPGSEPRVVAGYEDGELISVLYTYEVLLFGLRTGFAFGGDYMGRGLILCAPEREQQLLAASCSFLLENDLHAMRLEWTPQLPGPVSGLSLGKPSVRMKHTEDPRTEGDWLTLKPDYEQFLASLGPHTRRNLRAYRRKTEAAGITYTGLLEQQDFEGAMRSLNQLADYPMEPERKERDKRFFTAFGTPVIAGLRSADGEYVSLVTGFTSDTHLHVLTQLNGESEHLRKLSLSLVLRGYLIEEFILRGFTAVHFYQGSSAMLGRFCADVNLQQLAIDDASILMTPFKQACSTLGLALQRRGHRVPHRLQWAAGSYWL